MRTRAGRQRPLGPAGRLHPPGLEAPWLGYCDGEPACAWVGADLARGLDLSGGEGWFEEVAGDADRSPDVGGVWGRRPWDLVARNADHLARDFAARGLAGLGDRDPAGLAIVGPADRLLFHESARIDPDVVLDTTGGPITVEPDVVIQAFSRVEGPCYIGRGTQLFRANLRGGVTPGPDCRIGGEVEASIVHGHFSKYHEGSLGHAYVGEWVNLGALTSNFDLRKDNREVHVPLLGDPAATGRAKIGCFVGDDTWTGMGSMLNTGTALGAMCTILPAGPLLPDYVPSFSWVLHGRVAPGFGLDRLFATARTVKERRDQEFTSAEEELFTHLFEWTRMERERGDRLVGDRRNEHRAVPASF